MIVPTNKVKDIINERATLTYTSRTNQPVHWYYCLDKHNGREIGSIELRNHLGGLHSGSTLQRMGKIPLVIGMPVMIGQNFDVDAGIMNG
ncbi:uncharacterized protein F5891DRAFT_961777, partial [Suillus fuscotomentosus]